MCARPPPMRQGPVPNCVTRDSQAARRAIRGYRSSLVALAAQPRSSCGGSARTPRIAQRVATAKSIAAFATAKNWRTNS